MFLNLLSKSKEVDNVIYSPCNGKLIPLNEVKDEVFASGSIGKGVGIIPSNGSIYAPFSGTIEMVFPTLHAFGMKSSDGKELLVHIGIDTVELQGHGFKAHIKKGDKVRQGQKLMDVDLDYLTSKGKDTTTMLIVTNWQDYKSLNVVDTKEVSKGDRVITLER